jgi:hypothetical protein
MELAPSRVETTARSSEPSSAPTLHLITHPDGLGWQVTATQEWIDRETIVEQEYWRGVTYKRAESALTQTGYTAATLITCPGSLLAHLFIRMYHVIGLFDGPSPTWKHVKGLCVAPLLGFDPTSSTWEERPGPPRHETTIQQSTTRSVPNGRIQIRWTHAQLDPVGTEYPLDTRNPTVDIRLREVAQVLLRTHSSEMLTQGQMELALLTPDGVSTAESLLISPSTLKVALGSDLVRRPQADWPAAPRVRIETASPDLASLTQTVLTQLRMPIVTRGSNAAPLREAQQKEVSPLFDDTFPASIGHWTGANVLLSLSSTPLTATTQFITVSASSIETGLLLGQFTLEGSNVTSPDVASALRSQLVLLLTPEGMASRRGTMIEERR